MRPCSRRDPTAVDLVPQTPDCTLSRGMHWLNFMYEQYFKCRYERRGRLFQGTSLPLCDTTKPEVNSFA